MKNIVVGWVALLGIMIPVTGVVYGIFRFWEAVGISNKEPNHDAVGATLFSMIGLSIATFVSYHIGHSITRGSAWRRNELWVRETVARKRRELR